MIDAFVGAVVPRPLVTVEALALVARAAPLALVNIVDDRSPRELRLVATAVSTAHPQAWALGGPISGVTRRRDGNASYVVHDPAAGDVRALYLTLRPVVRESRARRRVRRFASGLARAGSGS